MEIAINRSCSTSFCLSKEVFRELGLDWNGGYLNNEIMGIESENPYAYRADPRLIGAIKKVGLDKSGGYLVEIAIIEIPDNIDWYIDDCEGFEVVHEKHRTWQ